MMLRRTTLLALTIALLAPAAAWSQIPIAPSTLGLPPGAAAPGYAPGWGVPAGYEGPVMLPPVEAPYGVMPAAFQPPVPMPENTPTPMQPGPPMTPPMAPAVAPPGMSGDPAMYGPVPGAGEGCGDGSEEGQCSEYDRGFRNMLFPTDAGMPRWYNIDAQFLLLSRETGAGSIPLASLGVGGPIVLSTSQFEFTEEPGVRVGWQTVLGPGDALELTYMGAFFFQDGRQATSGTSNLFTAFSDFGNSPFGGFSDTDAASLLITNYESELNSLELHYRYRWISPNNRINNSLLLGVRYVRLEEQFRFQGQTADGTFDYRTDTENNSVGFQVGGDLYVRVLHRLLFGGEIKAGIYGNDALQRTRIAATTVNPEYAEELHRTVCSFASEANMMAIVQVSTHCSLKAGYELVYLDRVALAPLNFNPTPIFLGPRTPTLNTAGEAFYHGLTAGFEWTW